MTDHIAENEESTTAGGNTTPDITTMFGALLEQMKTMNENFSSFCSPGEEEEEEEEGSETDAQDGDHDTRFRELLSKSSTDSPGEGQSSDVLKDIAQDLSLNEKTGPPISKELADIFTGLIAKKMDETKLKEKMDQHVKPENMEDLRVLKVNPLVWNQLSSQMRTLDSKSQKSQAILLSSIIACVKAADIVVRKYGSDRELTILLADSVALGLQYNHEENQLN